jgi:YesN/AraC family two-component response regulator
MERKTVFLVEDDEVLRDILRGTLEREYHVLEAVTCAEAVGKAKEQFDLALIDYHLPDGDGFEVIKSIRKEKPKLPVMVMTAYGTEKLAIRSLRWGAIDYLKKPFSFAYLREKVSGILDGTMSTEYPEGLEGPGVFTMDNVLAFLDKNYAANLTCEKISAMTSMNRNKFSVLFKKRFGQTFTTYLNHIRVKRAAELLKNSDFNIGEIAQSVGYKTLVHFERVFRKVYAKSPREYRKRGPD